MKMKTIAFILLAVLLALFATPVYAQSVPALPHAFYGVVEVNGDPAPVGIEVEARGDGVLTGVDGNPVVTTADGKYGSLDDPFEPMLIVQGDIEEGATLTFYVSGVSTGQTAEWHSTEVTELNLTATISGSPPDTTDESPPDTTDESPPGTTDESPPGTTDSTSPDSTSETADEEPTPPAPPAPPAPPTAPVEPVNWPVLWGVIGGVIIVGLMIFLVARRKKAY